MDLKNRKTGGEVREGLVASNNRLGFGVRRLFRDKHVFASIKVPVVEDRTKSRGLR
jgi:hypothetical protein